jgi:hypothetical protein
VFAGRGSKVVRTKRSSLIVHPRNGRIPQLTPAGQTNASLRLVAGRPGGPADGPEDRPHDDRCFGVSLPVQYGHPATAGGHSRIVQGSGMLSIY